MDEHDQKDSFSVKTLPDGLVTYKRTPEFNQDTVPAGLLKSHQTKAGTWGNIIISSGKLVYRILEPELEEIELSPEQTGCVEPTVLHELVISEPVSFHVQFLKSP